MIKKLMAAASCLAALLLPIQAQACTLFAAQGEVVQGGGSLIAKVRDYRPDCQKLRLNTKGQYPFYALYAGKNPDKLSIRAGLNAKGLVAVVAMASCIPKAQRQTMLRKPCLERVLQNCASVDEALVHTEFFYGPRFVMLADKGNIACVEVGDGGALSIREETNTYLSHTNYYKAFQFSDLNIRIKDSPRVRAERIEELLEAGPTPFTKEQFISFTQDQDAGPDNSIWRVGSTEKISQSLAAWVVDIRPDGDFSLWLKYRPEPEERGKEKILELKREDIFH